MDIQYKYNFYCGTARGVLCNSQCDKGRKPKFSLDKDNPSVEITEMEWGRSDDEIVIGNTAGDVKLFNIPEDRYVSSIKDFEGEGPVVGLVCNDTSVFVARKSGHISLRSNDNNDVLQVKLDGKGTLNKMVYNTAKENIATGGEGTCFRLWDVKTKECIFQAKSLGHDELNLPIPTSIRDICFFPSDPELGCCATKEGMVLVYDRRSQRRPIVKFTEPKASYTTLSTSYRERQCLVGTTRGYLQLLDMRVPSKCLKTYKNFTGSVTGITCDPVSPIVATACMDRFMRVHNLETKELLHKEYMKQSLTRILMKPIIKEEKQEDEDDLNRQVDEEYEELFNNMETISDDMTTNNRKKQKNLEYNEMNIKIKKKKVGNK